MRPSGKPIHAEDYGSYGDTAAIQAAIDLSATGSPEIQCGVPVYIGPGIWTGQPLSTRSKPLTIMTAGRMQTDIKVTNAAIVDMLSIDAPFVCEGLTISSVVAASARLGAGIRVLSQAGIGVRLTDILSTGHQFGLNSAAPAIWLNDFEASFNYSHGAQFGDGATPQNELRLNEVQLNANGGDGLLVIGPSTGIQANHPVTVANKGNGIRFVKGAAPVHDVFLVCPEISDMTDSIGYGINTTQNLGGSNFNIYGGMAETGSVAAFLTGIDGVTVNGMSVTGHTLAGLIVDCRGASINGGMFYGNAADVIVGANSRNATLAGLSSDPEVRISTIGIRCDAGCGPIHASSIVLRASTPWAGSIPAGSKIRGCYGIADQG